MLKNLLNFSVKILNCPMTVGLLMHQWLLRRSCSRLPGPIMKPTMRRLSAALRCWRRYLIWTPLPRADLLKTHRNGFKEHVGVQSYTRYLNEALGEQEKFDVVTALWRIAHASNGVDRFEEHTIRRIADLLYLSHDRFIQAKLLARQS